jgi:molybdenum cofactor biosynthesis enzyme MoaA
VISAPPTFNDAWRRQKSAAFQLDLNSTARQTIEIDLWGRRAQIYANANLSIYSAQKCNAACPFCVEELRPASRGVELVAQKAIESDDERYFDHLAQVLQALQPLRPSVSITGGEPSKDPRLPRILRATEAQRQRTLTTNGSGLLDFQDGKRVIDWIALSCLDHLNLSIAHPDRDQNIRLMRLPSPLSNPQLREVVAVAQRAGTRVRLSCALLKSSIATLSDIFRYLDFAQSLGVDNVIFRQLMKTDPHKHLPNSVVRFSNQQRVPLEPLLDEISSDARFEPVRQIMGYYYYVEVWRYAGMSVVFEEADLAQLEKVKRQTPDAIHELVFHPSGALASTWQPWDGVLGPNQ